MSKLLIVPPDEGRRYDMGRMRAVFFADGEQTNGRYSISEWWLDARTGGPGEHQHPEDHIFYILQGVLTLVTAGERSDVSRGSYVVIPGQTPHDFENRGQSECGFISINAPGGFESMLPGLVNWFAEKPLTELDEP